MERMTHHRMNARLKGKARTGLGIVGADSPRIYNASMEASFQCAGCGEWNETGVDESAGSRQSYVEDCQVCCRPNVLRAEYDMELGAYFITAELESS
jgi:hypothetical protein